MKKVNKTQIRKDYKIKRSLLSNTDIKKFSLDISNQLYLNFNFENKFIHTFFGVQSLKEIDTNKINNHLIASNCKVATSITQSNPLSLNHSLITSNTEFILDHYNIPIPSKIIPINVGDLDIILIPLLAFDKQGNRIGYGKGLYDSFLKDCKSTCIKIGLSFFEVYHDLIPSEKHDIKLDFCITPNRMYNLSK